MSGDVSVSDAVVEMDVALSDESIYGIVLEDEDFITTLDGVIMDVSISDGTCC